MGVKCTNVLFYDKSVQYKYPFADEYQQPEDVFHVPYSV